MNPRLNDDMETLSDTGLAVFRPVDTTQATEVSLSFHERTKDIPALSTRGIDTEKDLAVNLLSVRETRGNKVIGHLAVQAVNESIYGQLFDLRDTFEARVIDTELIRTGEFLHAALMLDAERVDLERQAIVGILKSMANIAVEDSLGFYDKTPLVSLGKVATRLDSKSRRQVGEALDSSAPPTIKLDRAKMYSPPKHRTGGRRRGHRVVVW